MAEGKRETYGFIKNIQDYPEGALDEFLGFCFGELDQSREGEKEFRRILGLRAICWSARAYGLPMYVIPLVHGNSIVLGNSSVRMYIDVGPMEGFTEYALAILDQEEYKLETLSPEIGFLPKYRDSEWCPCARLPGMHWKVKWEGREMYLFNGEADKGKRLVRLEDSGDVCAGNGLVIF